MIEVIVTVVGILGIGCVIGEVIWRCMERRVEMRSGFTPGRRTRGIARWWARCTRWTHRLRVNYHETVTSTLQPVPWVMTREQVITARQMQQIGRAMAGVNDRPTPAEFAAAPLYGDTMVDRMLRDLDAMDLD